MADYDALYPSRAAKDQEPIPDYLIRDILDGVPYYYKGYKSVLNKSKTLEEIMGSSGLQAEIVMYLNFLLTQALGIEQYRIYTSESGIHISKHMNYGLDLAVYDANVLSSDKVDDQYVKVAPQLVVEIDVKVNTNQLSEEEFIYKKTQSLLDYGVKTVIWVTSKSGKVLIAKPEKDWIVRDWNKEFILFKDIEANIGAFLKERGVKPN